MNGKGSYTYFGYIDVYIYVCVCVGLTLGCFLFIDLFTERQGEAEVGAVRHPPLRLPRDPEER